jgi:hypothetical protein
MLSPTTPTAPDTWFPAFVAGAGAGAGAAVWGVLGFGFDVCAASKCAVKVIGAMISVYSQRDCMSNSIGCDRIGKST